MKSQIKAFSGYPKSDEVLDKLKSKGLCADCLSTYDFSTLCTTLSHILIKGKNIDLIGRTFQRGCVLYLTCDYKNASFIPEEHTRYKKFEQSHEITVLFVLRKPILQARMHSHPVGLDV